MAKVVANGQPWNMGSTCSYDVGLPVRHSFDTIDDATEAARYAHEACSVSLSSKSALLECSE